MSSCFSIHKALTLFHSPQQSPKSLFIHRHSQTGPCQFPLEGLLIKITRWLDARILNMTDSWHLRGQSGSLSLQYNTFLSSSYLAPDDFEIFINSLMTEDVIRTSRRVCNFFFFHSFLLLLRISAQFAPGERGEGGDGVIDETAKENPVKRAFNFIRTWNLIDRYENWTSVHRKTMLLQKYTGWEKWSNWKGNSNS